MGPKRVRELIVNTVCSNHNSSSSSARRHAGITPHLTNRSSATRKRELVLEVEGAQKSKGAPKTEPKRLKTLDLLTPLVERLKENNQKAFSLPLTSKELQALETDFKKVHFRKDREDLADDTSESGSTSSEVKEERKGGKQRLLKGRQKGILKKFVDAKLEKIGSQSMLETFSVTPRVREQYNKKMEELRVFLKEHHLPFVTNHDIDSALVKYFNQKFLEGEQSHFGDYTMASLMDRNPSFRKKGGQEGASCLEVSPWMEASLSKQISFGPSSSSMVCDQLANGSTGAPAESHFQFGATQQLSAPWQSFEASEDWTCQANCWDHPELVLGDLVERDLGCVEDWRKGRQHYPRLGLHPVFEPIPESDLERQEELNGVDFQLCRVPLCLSFLLQGPQDQPSPLPGKAFRPKHRPPASAGTFQRCNAYHSRLTCTCEW